MMNSCNVNEYLFLEHLFELKLNADIKWKSFTRYFSKEDGNLVDLVYFYRSFLNFYRI